MSKNVKLIFNIQDLQSRRNATAASKAGEKWTRHCRQPAVFRRIFQLISRGFMGNVNISLVHFIENQESLIIIKQRRECNLYENKLVFRLLPRQYGSMWCIPCLRTPNAQNAAAARSAFAKPHRYCNVTRHGCHKWPSEQFQWQMQQSSLFPLNDWPNY